MAAASHPGQEFCGKPPLLILSTRTSETFLILSIENLCVTRGERPIIDGLSFNVGSGEALVVMGANGSGKTTLLRALAGFIQPKSGAILLDGHSEDARISDACHYVGHLNAIKTSQTVAENLSFYAGFLDDTLSQAEISDRVEDALARFALDRLASVPSGYLSAGQKRRLALARVLCAARPIWLLDEPTTSLDQESTTQLASVINAHVASGGVAIAATHLDLGLEPARTLQLDQKARSA